MTETGRKNNYANYNFALASFFFKKAAEENEHEICHKLFRFNIRSRKNEVYDKRLQSLDAHFRSGRYIQCTLSECAGYA